jgi:hypothetical protein
MAYGTDKDNPALVLWACYRPYAIHSFPVARDERRFTNDGQEDSLLVLLELPWTPSC